MEFKTTLWTLQNAKKLETYFTNHPLAAKLGEEKDILLGTLFCWVGEEGLWLGGSHISGCS
jgi:hypothetical protein